MGGYKEPAAVGRRGKTAEEMEQSGVHTQREERQPDRESEIHADEDRSRHMGGQGMRHIPG